MVGTQQQTDEDILIAMENKEFLRTPVNILITLLDEDEIM